MCGLAAATWAIELILVDRLTLVQPTSVQFPEPRVIVLAVDSLAVLGADEHDGHVGERGPRWPRRSALEPSA